MKRILLSTCIAALLPAMALAQTANPNAKVDPKNNKVSTPVVEKPKVKLMTRDELRSCMIQQRDNVTEAQQIKTLQAEQKTAREALVAENTEMGKRQDELVARVATIKAEQEDILKEHAAIQAEGAKMEAEALKARQLAYLARAKAFDEKVDAHNKAKDAFVGERKSLDARIDAHNKAQKDLAERADAYLDKNDAWRTGCMNKSYDENDEIALKKELGVK